MAKKYPLISLAADLVELVELSSCDHAPGVVTITSPRSDFFIGRIDISGNCGIVLRPRYLVGVSDGIQVRTRWNFNLHNLISGRIRQVILYGSGTVFIIGAWGIDCTRADCRYDSKIEDNLILGYETSAEYSLCRTETFWHYLRNSTTLLDLQLRQGAFLTQNNACIYTAKDESMFERAVKTLLGGIGSLLGL